MYCYIIVDRNITNNFEITILNHGNPILIHSNHRGDGNALDRKKELIDQIDKVMFSENETCH